MLALFCKWKHLRRPLATFPSVSGDTFMSAAGDTAGGMYLYLQRAKLIDSLRLRLQSHDASSPFPLPCTHLLDSFVAARAIRSADSPESALSLYKSLLSLPSFSPSHHPSVLLSLSRRLPGHPLPSSLPLLLRLRLLVTSNDLPSALNVFSSLPRPCTEAYNLIIGLHSAAGDHSSALSVFSQLLSGGAVPNSRTYTVIIDHLVQSKNADTAMEIFRLLPSMRVRRTSKQYNVLATAFSSQFNHLLNLIQEMRADGILPGRPMLAAISDLRAAGFVAQTDEFARDLCLDQRIGYAVDCAEEEEEEEEKEDFRDKERVRLKPWIDPAALARALEGWNSTDVALLEAAGFVWSTRLVCKLLRSFRTAKTAWNFFCWVAHQPDGFAHDRYTVSRMICILARDGHAELIDRLLDKLESEGILLPFATVRLAIDFYGYSKNAEAAIGIYRKAEAICEPLSRLDHTILSSSLLRTVTKSGKGIVAMDLVEEMMAEGIHLDLQTFSGLMEYFGAEEGDLRTMQKLLGMAKQCGMEPDAVMYEVMIKACCHHERAALGLRMLKEMLEKGLKPCEKTKGALVKRLWKEGKLREAATVEEMCEEIGELPFAQMGHVWTVSAADFERVRAIYTGGFSESVDKMFDAMPQSGQTACS